LQPVNPVPVSVHIILIMHICLAQPPFLLLAAARVGSKLSPIPREKESGAVLHVNTLDQHTIYILALAAPSLSLAKSRLWRKMEERERKREREWVLIRRVSVPE
jgi:hypothetical protein